MPGTVMDGEHVHLIVTNQPAHDSVRPPNNLAHVRIIELWNRSPRFRKAGQLLDGGDQSPYGYRCVVRRVLTDEGVDCGEVGLSLFRPKNDSHDANRFLTSSCDKS